MTVQPPPAHRQPLTRLLVLAAFSLCAFTIACSGSDAGTVGPPYVPPIDTTPPPDGGGGGNGEPSTDCKVSNGGECRGDVLHYCDKNIERTVDCSERFEEGTCARAGVNSLCTVQAGASCISDEGEGRHFARCEMERGQSYSMGCISTEYDGDYTCARTPRSCSTGDVNTCIEGRYLVDGCLNSQPRLTDCEALGGSCSGYACKDLPVGATCEMEGRVAKRRMICAYGLECRPASQLHTTGVCKAK